MANTIDTERPVLIRFQANVDDIQARKLTYLVNGLQTNGITKAELHISSGGGSTTQGIALYNLLKSLPIEFTTHNVGVVDSSASPMYLAGDHRYINQNASFLIHGVRWDFGNEHPNLQKIESVAKEMRREQAAMATTISRSTQLTKKRVTRMMRGETIISPKKALKYGIAEEIKEATVSANAQIFTIVNPPRNVIEQDYLNEF